MCFRARKKKETVNLIVLEARHDSGIGSSPQKKVEAAP